MSLGKVPVSQLQGAARDILALAKALRSGDPSQAAPGPLLGELAQSLETCSEMLWVAAIRIRELEGRESCETGRSEITPWDLYVGHIAQAVVHHTGIVEPRTAPAVMAFADELLKGRAARALRGAL